MRVLHLETRNTPLVCDHVTVQLFTSATGGYLFKPSQFSTMCEPSLLVGADGVVLARSGTATSDGPSWSVLQRRLLVRHSVLCPGLTSAPNIHLEPFTGNR